MTIKRILVPVLGQSEKDALHRSALYFAGKMGASLINIHFSETGTSPNLKDAPLKETEKSLLEKHEQDCRDRSVSCELISVSGNWEEVSSCTDADDLIALPFELRRPFIGLKPENSFLSSSCPVLFSPQSYIDIESIALAYDSGEHAKRALDVAVYLSEKAAWPLTVLMVAESQAQGVEWMDDVEAYLETLTINSATVILAGGVESALRRFMREGSVELLIMGAGGRQEGPKSMIGLNAAAMIGQGHFPLLMVP